MEGLFSGFFSKRTSSHTGSPIANIDVNVPIPQAQRADKEPIEPPAPEPRGEASDESAYPNGFRLTDFEGDVELALAALKQLDDEERGTSFLINDVAEALRDAKRYDEARALFTEALAARRYVFGDKDHATLTAINNLGLHLREMGEYDDARSLLAEAVATRRAAQGDSHPETLTSLNNLASCLKALGALDEAKPLYEEALATRRSSLGDDHADTLTSINNLASLYRALKELEKAEVLYFEAAITAQKVLGVEHPHTRVFAANLKATRQARNPLGEAVFTQPTGQVSHRKQYVQPGGRRRPGGASVR